MKALEFTGELKDKLILVTKTLYPDFKMVHTSGQDIRIFDCNYKEKKIHWFEFFFVHVLHKLQQEKSIVESPVFTLLMRSVWQAVYGTDKQHPIDVLYEFMQQRKWL